jgi:hypothetical protein
MGAFFNTLTYIISHNKQRFKRNLIETERWVKGLNTQPLSTGSMAEPVSAEDCMTTARNKVLYGAHSAGTEYCITTGPCGFETEQRVITLTEHGEVGLRQATHTHTHAQRQKLYIS